MLRRSELSYFDYMKSVLFIALLTSLLNLSAQDLSKKFGIRAGINYSLMNFNKAIPPPQSPVKNIRKPGFFVGALLQLHLNRSLSLQPEYTFSQMHGEDDRIKSSYTINYFTLPLI